MRRFESPLFVKFSLFVLSALFIFVFFYFEPSNLLRVLVILLALLGIWLISKTSEINTYLLLYLAVFDFYNLHYGFSIPLAILMLAIFFLSYYLFMAQALISGYKKILDKNVFTLYGWVTAVSVLEFFAAMNFWPLNPMTKSLIITVTFFLFGRIFYLFVYNMLNFKRAFGFIVTTILIFAVIIFLNLQFGL